MGRARGRRRPRRPQRRRGARRRTARRCWSSKSTTQVGDPVHCTGVLGLDAFTEFDLPRDTICTITRTARFHGRARPHASASTAARSPPRSSIAAGSIACSPSGRRAPARRSCAVRRVQAVDVAARGVTATRRRCRWRPRRSRGRVCVLACGAQYRFNRQLGLGIPRAYLQTAQLETPFPRGRRRRDRSRSDAGAARVRVDRAVPSRRRRHGARRA